MANEASRTRRSGESRDRRRTCARWLHPRGRGPATGMGGAARGVRRLADGDWLLREAGLGGVELEHTSIFDNVAIGRAISGRHGLAATAQSGAGKAVRGGRCGSESVSRCAVRGRRGRHRALRQWSGRWTSRRD